MGYDGIICGHLHVPKIVELEGVLYCNDGDWIDSCTGIVEQYDGTLELIHWLDQRDVLVDIRTDAARPQVA